MKMTNKPDYIFHMCGEGSEVYILYLEDRNLGAISLTNGMDLVLDELATMFKLPSMIIYKDSDGEYARVDISGKLLKFRPMPRGSAEVFLARLNPNWGVF